MKKIWIVHSSRLIGESFIRQYESYAKSIEKAGYLPQTITTEMALETDEKPLFAIFMDKDIYAAQMLENKGIKLFNSSECIRICDDKALTYIRLEKEGVPIPKTVIPPKIYYGSTDDDICRAAAEKLGFPIILKECFGSFGQQVYLAENERQMLDIKEKIGKNPFVFQKFLENSRGFDIRVIVSGKNVIGAVKRVNVSDFRSNVENGGKTEEYTISDEQKNLAVRAAQAVGADFAGVDLIMGSDGFKVCEVNSNFHFHGAQKFIDICIPDKIIEDLIFLWFK